MGYNKAMFTVRHRDEFDQWLRGLRDVPTRARLLKRLKKDKSTQNADIEAAKALAQTIED